MRSVLGGTVLLLAACSAAATPQAKPAPTLLLSTRSGVDVVSAASGALRFRVAGGLATADGATIVTVEGDRLVARDSRNGSIRQAVHVGPGLIVSTISADGRLVALATTAPATYLPAGRGQTQLTMVRLPGGTVNRYNLTGNFAPDAFTSDGSGLFLVDYLPARAPDRYQITWLDLSSGEVTGVFGRQKEALEDMRGLAGTRALAPDRTTLYTLYLRPPAQPGTATDSIRAEVHTLKLDQNWAHCIDLPEGFGGRDLSFSALAVSSDGRRLYVVDRAARRLVEVDTDALAVTRSVDLPFTAAEAPTSVVVSGDGRLYVSDGPGIITIRTDTLAVAGRWKTLGSVTALAVESDGRGLLASTPSHVEAFEAGSGRHTSTPVPADAIAIAHVLT